MKPPERFAPDDPREWLNRAKSSLTIANNRVPDVYLEDLCFEAQQAAEKAIKAVMIKHNIDFPYVHNVALLLSMLEELKLTPKTGHPLKVDFVLTSSCRLGRAELMKRMNYEA